MATETTFLGNLVNVMGAMLLFVAAYFYVQFRRLESSVRQRVARQRTTAVLLFFLLFAYATTVFFPSSGAWTVNIGLVLGEHFNQMATSFSMGESGKAPLADQLLSRLKLVGLVVYIALFTIVSLAVKIPANILREITNRL